MFDNVQHYDNIQWTPSRQTLVSDHAGVDIKAMTAAMCSGIGGYFNSVHFKVFLRFKKKEAISASDFEQPAASPSLT